MTDLNLASSGGNSANEFPEWEVRCKGCGSCLCTKLLYLKLPIEGNKVVSKEKCKETEGEKIGEKSSLQKQDGRVEGCVLIFSCEYSKITTHC